MSFIIKFIHLLRKPEYTYKLVWSLLFLSFSAWLNFQAGTYAFSSMSNGVGDLFLDHIPVYNISWLFIQGAVVMAALIFVLCIVYAPRMPDVTATIGLLFFVRAIAIILTHLGPPLDMRSHALADTMLGRFIQGGDYFFSGHTALPFMVALLFWDKTWIRNLFFILTGVFGTAAILGHVHYSIDVFAAPFMAHGIYTVRKHLWKV